MKNRAVLTIDLGSGYSKVAIRSAWNAHAELVRGVPGASRDVTFCIPSTVARTSDHGNELWLIGADAVAQRPDGQTSVFNNWKPAFLAGSTVAPLGGGPAEDASLIAEHYLRGLRRALRSSLPEHEIDDLALRLCVPKLDGVNPDPLIEAVCVRAGWQLAKGRPTVFEPEANALGVVTRGRNATWHPRGPHPFQPDPGRTVLLPQMLDPDLSARMQMAMQSDRRGMYGVLVTDIGTFTTDFGLIRFDLGFHLPTWNRPVVEQQSLAIGIGDLDALVRQRLRGDAQRAIEQMSVADWERAKQKLYQGEPWMATGSDGKPVMIGGGGEGRGIVGTIAEFGRRIQAVRDEFVAAHAAALPFEEVFSGGGAAIPALLEVLNHRPAPSRLVHMAQSFAALLRPGVHSGVPGAVLDSQVRIDRDLRRGGSAIGGCSVFLEDN